MNTASSSVYIGRYTYKELMQKQATPSDIVCLSDDHAPWKKGDLLTLVGSTWVGVISDGNFITKGEIAAYDEKMKLADCYFN